MTSSARITMLSMSSLALALAAGVAAAQSLPPPYASYAAKFSCGTAADDADVVRGTYATSVNIHNPQANTPVTFFKKVVTAPEEGGPGVSRIVVLSPNEVLKPDRAEQVDCPLIVKALQMSGHIEGFVVIEVPPQPAGTTGTPPFLDVVGKYTARGGAQGFDVVVYLPKLITR